MVDIEALWDYNQPAKSEHLFRELLPPTQADPGLQAELPTQIARAQGLQQKFDAAHQTLKDAQALITEDQLRARARHLLEHGRVLNSSGDRDQALGKFEKALAMAERAKEDFLAVDAAHMIAIAHPAKAMEWNLHAVKLALESEDPRARKWLGSLYNNLGWTMFEREDYEGALDYFKKALDERRRQGADDLVRIARWCIAKTNRSMGKVEAALEIQEKLRMEYEALGAQDGYVFEELAECLLSLGRAAEAAPHFAEAYAVLSQDPWLRENEPSRLARLSQLASAEPE